MGPLLVGIDVGTSKVKVCIFDNQGNIISQASQDSTISYPSHGLVEIDLSNLMVTIKKLLKEVSTGYGNCIESIGFSVTSPTLVLFDEKLNPLRPGIVYLDNRSSKEVSRYVDVIGGAEKYFSRIGNNPSPSTCTVGLINWLRKNEPKVWGKTYKIGYLNTFLAAQFTGEIVVDPTIASYSGLMNIAQPDNWDEELVRISGIDKSVLPEVKHSYYKAGELKVGIAKETGLKAGIAVVIGSADTAAASFALGLKEHGDVFESMGTSEVLTFCLNKPEFDKSFMMRSHVVPGLWLAHGAMSTTGAAINWALEKLFPEFKEVDDLEKEAFGTEPGSNGVLFLPYLSGERSPIFDPYACGLFFGLNLNTNRASIIRSVYEGAAYGIRQLYSIAQNRWLINPEFIRCVGGATKSPLALKVRADVLNVSYKSMEADHASAYGAALLGGIGAGIFKDFDNIPYWNSFLGNVYPDSEKTEIYNKYYKIYTGLYPNLKELMHEMAEPV